MRMKRTNETGSAFDKMTAPKDYLYSQNSAVVHSPNPSLSPTGRAREDRYNLRRADRDEVMRQKKMEEEMRNKNLLILKKKEMAEERFNYRRGSNNNHTSALFNDPMNVVASLRDRCRQKPQLLNNMFPPKDTSTMGMVTAEDLLRGLRTMGFDLPPKKFQLVLSVLGLSSALGDSRSIPIAQLKNAVLEKRLENHQEESHWKERGGGGTLAAKYKQRALSNLGDPAVDKLNELDEMGVFAIQEKRRLELREKNKIVINLSDTARMMLKKLGERFSTVRRAFRTMDKDRSGSLTKIEFKNILDTFCMEVSNDDFEKLMNYFDADHDGLISYEEFLTIVRNEIQPQILAGARGDDDPANGGGTMKPQKPSEFDPKSRRRPKRQFQTEYAASYVRPGYLPLKSLDELKIYHDFLKKISTEFNNVQEAFVAMDIHREGYITRDELKDVLDNFAFKMSNAQFEALINVFDTDHDGKISYDEFLQQVKYCDDLSAQEEEDARVKEMLEFDKSPAAQRRLQKMKNRTRKVTSYEFLMEKINEKASTIHQAFKMMDTDRSGSLSAGELKALLDSYCYKVPDEIFANMLSLFDADGDGEISYHEFMAQVKRSVNGESGFTPEMDGAGSGGGGGGGGSAGNAESQAKMKANAAERRRIAKKQKTLKTLLGKIGDRFSTVRRAFREMDKDSSGTLDYDELRRVLESTGYKIEDEVFDDILEVFDSNCDGEVDYQEFLAQLKDYIQAKEEGGIGSQLAAKAGNNAGRHGALQNRELSSVEKAHQAKTVGAALRFLCEKIHEKWGDIKKSFQMLDWDKSGTITSSELRAVLDDCCYTTTDDVFNQVIAIFDQDGDGSISYNELLGTLKKVVNGEIDAAKPASVNQKEQFRAMVNNAGANFEEGNFDNRLQNRRKSFQRDSYGPPPDAIGVVGQLPSRFNTNLTNIPNLGHGHLHICKSIHQRISVIGDALRRLDYDKKYFISSEELKASVETYCGRLNPVLWDDILHFFDPSMTGLVDYLKFLDEIRAQATADVFEYDDNGSAPSGSAAAASSMKQGFKAGREAGMMNSSKYSSHMQNGVYVTNKGSAMGTGSHGSSDVAASMKFLCEKIYEKFPSIRNAFMSLDTDRGGTIGKRELKNILDDCCYTVPDDTFEAIYKLFDTDGDGDVSYKEFMDQVKEIVEPGDTGGEGLSNVLINRDRNNLQRPGTLGVSQFKTQPGGASHTGEEGLQFLQTKLREQTESVRTAFRLLDNDQTGSVEYNELRRVLDNYCYKMNDDEFAKLTAVLDTDHDGKAPTVLDQVFQPIFRLLRIGDLRVQNSVRVLGAVQPGPYGVTNPLPTDDPPNPGLYQGLEAVLAGGHGYINCGALEGDPGPCGSFLSLEALTKAQVLELSTSSVDFIKSGFSSTLASSTAKTLSKTLPLSTSQTTMALTAIAKTLSESANRNHNEHFFLKSLSPYGLGDHVRDALKETYLANQKVIYDHTPDRGSSLPTYKDLSWTLSVEVSRRAADATNQPRFDVAVETGDGRGGGKTLDMVVEPGEMRRMEEEVKRALEEEKGQHSQRFQRYLN
ncbi:hypothetical protein TrRE_jg7355 [Triparma retinervis]|uniref:EF-hand domain-containing protein n=1 Tax=Triparma retinervis TaxID=2557542 RepID=A0A9W7F9N4_9STRA|nr:hypothetical protein TrRE_jg7355 [Triparma retinervis]